MPLTPHDLGLHRVLKYLTPLVRPALNRAATRRLRKAVNVSDVRACAEKRVHSMCFGYLDSGGDDEVSLRRNHDAYTQIEMHFKVCIKETLVIHDHGKISFTVIFEGPSWFRATPGPEYQNIWSRCLAAILHVPHSR